MEAQSAEQAYNEIVSFIKEQEQTYSELYCGIAFDWKDRLFNDHQVPRKNHFRITRKCYSDDDARMVETALIKRGCDGAPGGGDESTIYVYVYRKGTMTNP